ncbi:MAG: hypothetical protein QN183_11625 [Armatimonadota bacterium]|nr:hypothetical protein [Armatimonadota bacterium]MDR7485114.1 hypothetical protein [Armatimonadota bacterium]MDR7533502.1 hypothetical protein [Armatimonadota bacterium]MDR7536997.1 hypothetical protein [Armatimonadota bacterium]
MSEAVRMVFPPMRSIRLRLDGELRQELEVVIRERGWSVEEGVKILLGYAAAASRAAHPSPEETRNELGAARGELAVLRHRAFMAEDGIRTLRMNITGFEKSLEQFEKSLPRLEREHQDLQAHLASLLAEATRRGIDIAPEEPDVVPAHRRLIDLYRKRSDWR